MIIQGDAREIMGLIPDESIHCVITSPPYWGLRDYGLEPVVWDSIEGCEHVWGDTMPPSGQSGWHTFKREYHNPGCHKTTIGAPMKKTNLNQNKGHGNFCSLCSAWRGSLGLEPTFQLYIQHLIQVFDEVKKVLRPDGTCWVNLGDSYSGSGKGTGSDHGKAVFTDENIPKSNWSGVKPKSLCQIPSRFAIAMTDAGWILRNEIIWYKRNCMPSSAKDRFTVDWESVFFMVKSKKYWFEQQFEDWVQRPHDIERAKDKSLRYAGKHNDGYDLANSRSDHLNRHATGQPIGDPEKGRNKRCVWKPTKEDYLKWCEQWYDGNFGNVWDITTKPFKGAHFAVFPEDLVEPMLSAGCPVGGTVLDPFAGAGTVGLVAGKQGKDFIGIELNSEYCQMAEERIG